MKRTELVYMDAKSSKFWNIELDGVSHRVTYGRIGTSGQSATKEFPSEAKAEEAYDKLVREKLSKGYVAAQGSGVASPGAGGGAKASDEFPLISFISINRRDEVSENVKTFVGRKVVDYNPEKEPKKGGDTIYRFRSDWESDDCEDNLRSFLETDAAQDAVGIVIGAWFGDESDRDSSSIIKLLAESSAMLPKLAAIYLGDVVSEENEMSWIQQADISPLLAAYPSLQLLRARGGSSLQLSNPKHAKLRALALETGGMDVEVVRSVCSSDFPNLEHLELWLGTDEYGGNSSVQDLQPIFSGKLFPKLKYLGLRNCHYVDDIAGVIVNSPIIERIETLDLSLGTLSDEGAKALLSLPTGGSLKKVSIHHHYVGNALVKQLKDLKIPIDTSNPEGMDRDDDEWRFVAVGE